VPGVAAGVSVVGGFGGSSELEEGSPIRESRNRAL